MIASLGAAPLAIDGSGSFTVAIGRRWTDRLVARCCGHRRSGVVPIQLAVERAANGRQRWVRTVDGRPCTTTVRLDGRSLVERRGPIELRFVHRPGVVSVLGLVSWGLRFGPVAIPLPRFIAPAITCTTELVGAGLRVAVRVGRRPSVTYEGILS